MSLCRRLIASRAAAAAAPALSRRAFGIFPFFGSRSTAPAFFRDPWFLGFDPLPVPFFAPRFSAPIHISEGSDGTFKFEIDVPRYSADQIIVDADKESGVITVKGDQKGKGGQYSFERSFSVNPELLDLSKLTTSVANGLATITVPRNPEIAAKDAATQVAAGNDAAATSTTAPLATAEAQTDKVANVADRESFAAAAKMTWPPRFKVDDAAGMVTFTCEMPTAVRAENLDIHLERSGVLRVGINAHIETIKKDAKGNVTFSESKALSYATTLRVPQGTLPQDLAVTVKDGTLTIVVQKHAEDKSKIDVKQE